MQDAIDSPNAVHYNIQQRKRFFFVVGADPVVEYVTMGQIESAIEEYYQAHGTIMSFYAALIYLQQQGKTFTQQPIAPDFTKWNLNDLNGLLNMFAGIPIPLMVDESGIADERTHRGYYEAYTSVFKQPCLLQTLDHPEHERQPSNSVRIIYVLKGKCRMTLGKWVEALESENVVLLSSDMNIYLDTGREDIVLNIFIDRSYFTQSFFANMSGDNLMKQFFERTIYDAKDGILQFKVLQPDHVHNIFQRLMIEMCHRDNYSEEIILGYIRLLCVELSRASRIYSDSITDEWSGARNRLVQIFPSILYYIRSHYDNISLETLADHFHYDSAYLSKMFKRLTGSNFMDILTQTRLNAAKQLLKNTKKAPNLIAAEVGYDSYDHFARLFKKKYGVTPKEYRAKT